MHVHGWCRKPCVSTGLRGKGRFLLTEERLKVLTDTCLLTHVINTRLVLGASTQMQSKKPGTWKEYYLQLSYQSSQLPSISPRVQGSTVLMYMSIKIMRSPAVPHEGPHAWRELTSVVQPKRAMQPAVSVTKQEQWSREQKKEVILDRRWLAWGAEKFSDCGVYLKVGILSEWPSVATLRY